MIITLCDLCGKDTTNKCGFCNECMTYYEETHEAECPVIDCESYEVIDPGKVRYIRAHLDEDSSS